MLKGKGIKSNPREIAVQIVSNVPQNDLVQEVSQTTIKENTCWINYDCHKMDTSYVFSQNFILG